MTKKYIAKKSFFTKNKGFTAGNEYFLEEEEAKTYLQRNLIKDTVIKKPEVKTENVEKQDKKIIKKELTKK